MGTGRAIVGSAGVGDLVVITWEDAWQDRGTPPADPAPMVRETVGWLLDDGERVYVVAHERDPDENDTYWSVIPKSIVRDVARLRKEN